MKRPPTRPIPPRRLVRAAALPLLTLVLSGCATIFAPELQSIPVTSAPPGAEVLVDGVSVGVTPLTLELEPRTSYEVTLRLGGETVATTLESGVDSTYVALDVGPGLALATLSAIGIAQAARAGADTGDEALGVLLLGGPAIVALGAGVTTAATSVAIDASSGRWYRLSPSKVAVEFE